MKTIEVVAAIIFNANNQILIARRSAKKSLPGKWEFPGGKVEIGETHKSALQRELKEEMDIITNVDSFIGSNLHNYGDFCVNLYVYKTIYISGQFKLSDHDLIEWVNFEELKYFDFADADIPIIQKYKSYKMF